MDEPKTTVTLPPPESVDTEAEVDVALEAIGALQRALDAQAAHRWSATISILAKARGICDYFLRTGGSSTLHQTMVEQLCSFALGKFGSDAYGLINPPDPEALRCMDAFNAYYEAYAFLKDTGGKPRPGDEAAPIPGSLRTALAEASWDCRDENAPILDSFLDTANHQAMKVMLISDEGTMRLIAPYLEEVEAPAEAGATGYELVRVGEHNGLQQPLGPVRLVRPDAVLEAAARLAEAASLLAARYEAPGTQQLRVWQEESDEEDNFRKLVHELMTVGVVFGIHGSGTLPECAAELGRVSPGLRVVSSVRPIGVGQIGNCEDAHLWALEGPEGSMILWTGLGEEAQDVVHRLNTFEGVDLHQPWQPIILIRGRSHGEFVHRYMAAAPVPLWRIPPFGRLAPPSVSVPDASLDEPAYWTSAPGHLALPHQVSVAEVRRQSAPAAPTSREPSERHSEMIRAITEVALPIHALDDSEALKPHIGWIVASCRQLTAEDPTLIAFVRDLHQTANSASIADWAANGRPFADQGWSQLADALTSAYPGVDLSASSVSGSEPLPRAVPTPTQPTRLSTASTNAAIRQSPTPGTSLASSSLGGTTPPTQAGVPTVTGPAQSRPSVRLFGGAAAAVAVVVLVGVLLQSNATAPGAYGPSATTIAGSASTAPTGSASPTATGPASTRIDPEQAARATLQTVTTARPSATAGTADSRGWPPYAYRGPNSICTQVTFPQGNTLLRAGSTNEDLVTSVQSGLAALAYDVPVTGNFGSLTTGAVTRYQTNHSLTADGTVGQQTWTSLRDRLYAYGKC